MPVKEWPHGDRRRYWAGCHCVPCREANSAYVAEKRRAKRDAENPFPNALVWRIERPGKCTVHYSTLGSVRKAVYGIARATGGVVEEILVIDYWDNALNDWKGAWWVQAGTPTLDLPWGKK